MDQVAQAPLEVKTTKVNKMAKLVGGAGGGGSSGGSEASDNLKSSALLSIVDLLGEGQIGGLVDNSPSSVFLNDTPLASKSGSYNFEDVTWGIVTGTQDQDALGDGFNAVESVTSLNLKVTNASPAIFTVNDPNAGSVRVIVSTPGLTYTNSKGDISGSSVAYKFEVSVNGGQFYQVGLGQISGKTRSRYQRAYVKELPKTAPNGELAKSWTIRVTRTTPDSSNSRTSNDLYVDSYSTIIDTRLTYPNTAVFGLQVNAEQFTTEPQRSYLLDGLLIRVPSNRDKVSRTYNGVWDGTFKLEVCDNPAWILYDIITNERYGLGQYVPELYANAARLYEIGRYCDEMIDDGFGQGNLEPRFTINTTISSLADAFQLISDITSVFNGMAFWTGNTIGYMADMPTPVSMIYSPSNVIDGEFIYQGSSRKDRHSVVLVRYNDPDRNYETQTEYVEDSELIERFGVRKAEITAFGCTTRGQAYRVGKWLLYTEKYQSAVVTFKVGIDSALVLPGDVIQIVDPHRSGKRHGGRLVACTAKSATLDDQVTIETGSTISLRTEKGDVVERLISSSKVVTAADGRALTQVLWATALVNLPVKNSVWQISSPSVEPLSARVVSVGQGDNPGEFSISAIEHNPSKFDYIEKDMLLETTKTTTIDPKAVVEPTSKVTLFSEKFIEQDTTRYSLSIAWEQVTGAVSYLVKYRKESGNWIELPAQTGLSVDVENIYAGNYEASVQAISPLNSKSQVTYSELTSIEGSASVLPKLTSFAGDSLAWAIGLNWTFSSVSSGVKYTEIQQSLNYNPFEPGTETWTSVANVPFPAKEHTIAGLTTLDFRYFRARIVDGFNNYGEWSDVVLAYPTSDIDSIKTIIEGQVGIEALDSALSGKVNTTSADATKALADAKAAADAAIKEVADRKAAIAAEIKARTDSIKAQADALAKEATDRTAAIAAEATGRDAAIAAAAAKEAADRASAIAAEASARNTAITTAVSKEATDRAAAITAEATARGEAISAEATARGEAITAAVNKEVTDRTAAIAAESKARGEAIAAESLARTTAITKEVTNRNAAITAKAKEINADVAAKVKTLNDGITQEVIDRQAGDTEVVGQLNAYKTSNDKAVAAVLEKAETAISNDAATASKVTGLQSSLDTTNSNVSTVEKTSADADKALGIRIDTVVATAKTDKADVTALVTAETSARTSADTALSGRIDALTASTNTELGKTNAAVTAEQTARTSADTALGKRIDTVTANAATDKSTLQTAITTEQTARTTADTALGKRVDAVIATAKTDKADLTSLVSTETTARTNADSALGQRIDTLSASTTTELGKTNAAVKAEETARTSADTALGQRIDTLTASTDTELGKTNAAVTAEQTARTTADTALGKRIDAVVATAKTDKSDLQAAITSEQTARTTADTAMGSRIDTLSSTVNSKDTATNARIDGVSKTVADNNKALADRSTILESTMSEVRKTRSYIIGTHGGSSAVNTAGYTYVGRVVTPTGTLISGLSRGLNIFAIGSDSTLTYEDRYDVYGNSEALGAEQAELMATWLNEQEVGTRILIVGHDNIRYVGTGTTAGYANLRAALMDYGFSETFLKTLVQQRLPIMVGRKGSDRSSVLEVVKDGTGGNDWIQYPLTLVNGAPQGSAEAHALRVQADANASAIEATNTEVSRVNGEVVANASKISKLQTDLTAVDAKANTINQAAALAQQTANTAVTNDAATATALSQLKSTYETKVADIDKTIAANATKAASDLSNAKTTLANADKALGERIDTVNTTMSNDKTEVKGLITDVAKSVTTLEGSTNSKISGLQSSLNATNANVGKKLDATAINNYYTKAQSDASATTIAAGKVDDFKASLAFATGQNQVANPDFMDGLAGWTTTDLATGSTFEVVVIDGKRAAKLTHNRTSGSVTFRLYTNMNKAFQMVEGRKYEISVLVRADNVKGAVAGNYKLRLGEQTADGQDILKTERQFAADTNGQWIEYKIEWLATTTFNAFVNMLLSFATGSVYVTGVSFVDVTERKAINTNATAISATNTEVDRIDGVVKNQASSISQLRSDLTATDTKAGTALTNAATAQSTANTAVNNNSATAKRVDTLDASLKALSVGGANLFSMVNTKPGYINSEGDFGSTPTTGMQKATDYYIEVGKNKHLTYQLWNPKLVENGSNSARVAFYDANKVVLKVVSVLRLSAAQAYFVQTWDIPAGAAYVRINAVMGTVNAPAPHPDIKVQFEWGNMPTAWTAAPEDVQALIDANASEISSTKAEVKLVDGKVVSQTEALNTLKSTYEGKVAAMDKTIAGNATKAASDLSTVRTTLTNADTALGQRIDSVQTTMANDKTEVKGLITDVAKSVTTLEGNTNSKISNLQSSLNTTNANVAKKADASALNNYYTKTAADTAIAGQINSFDAKLVIGGVNLINRHDELKGKMVGQSGEIASYAGSSTINGYITVKADEPIILSKVGEATDNYFRYAFYDDADRVILRQASSNDLISLTVPESATRFRVSYPTTVSVQAERGTKATAIAPSSDDVQSQLDANSAAINSTNTEVGRINGTLTSQASSISRLQSDLTATNTKAGTAVANAATAQQTANTAVTGNASTASSLNQLKSAYDAKVIELDGKITTAGNKAASDLSSAQKTLANADKALGTRIDNLTTTVGNNDTAVKGQIKTVSDSVTTLSGSVNTRVDTLTASIKAANASSGDLIANPTFDPAYNQMGFTVVSTATAGVPAGCPFQYAAKISNRDHAPDINGIPCKQGDVFEMSALIACGGGVADFNLYVYKMTSPTSSVSALSSGANAKAAANAGKWQRVTWRWTVPASCNFFKPFLQINQSSPFGTVWYVTDWHCVNVTAAAQAKATADANATAIDVTNAEVRRVNGEVVAQGTKISTLESDFKAVDTKAGTAVKNAATAQTTANTGVTKADAVAARTSTLESKMATVESNVAKKADATALNSYYTKTAADSAIAGQVSGLKSLMTSRGQNLLLDGGFESYTTTSGYLTSYTADKRSGSKCAKFTRTQATNNGNNNDATPEGWFTSQPDRVYYIEYWVKKDPNMTVTPNANAYYNLGLYFQSIDGGSVSNSGWKTARSNKFTELTDSWQKFSGYVTAPEKTFQARLWMSISSSTANAQGLSLLIDDIYIADVTEGSKALSETSSLATAVSNTYTKTQTDSAISTAITTLRSTLNTAIGGKLDASAINNYYTKAETNSAIASTTTTLKSEVTKGYTDAIKVVDDTIKNIKLDSITIPDTRSANQLPTWYRTNYKSRMVNEFKTATVIGLTTALAGQTYVMLTTYVYYTDSSGGPIKQVAIGKTDDQTYIRYSTGSGSSEVWGAWVKQGAAMQTTITEQSQTIDGIKGIKTVTIDNNGVMSGYGLVSELVGGKVTSAFGVNADQFYVGSPKTGKKVFAVVNGQTVINDAVIGNLSASKITTGTMHGDRITAGTLTADKLSAVAIDAIALKAQNIVVYKDKTKPKGIRLELVNGLLSVYDDANTLRVRLGFWS